MYINIHEDANKISDLVFLYVNSDFFDNANSMILNAAGFSKHQNLNSTYITAQYLE